MKYILLVIYFLVLHVVLFSDEIDHDTINRLENKYTLELTNLLNQIYNNQKDFSINISLVPKPGNDDKLNVNSFYYNISILIDGNWKFYYENRRYKMNNDGTRKRIFYHLDQEDIEKLKNHIKNLFNIPHNSKNTLTIQSYQFDHSMEFSEIDKHWRRKQQSSMALFSGLVALIFLIMATIISRPIIILSRRARLKRKNSKTISTIDIRKASNLDINIFKEKFERSKDFLSPWIFPPDDYEKYINESKNLMLVYNEENNDIIGYFNISVIIRGYLQQCFLGYGIFVPHNRKGYMSIGLQKVLKYIFEELQLHRIEVNIQHKNRKSINFINKNGFVKEGYSKNYLKINDIWKDHERWALTHEMWLEMQ